MGRVDDVINVSGHRLGTAEVERPWYRRGGGGGGVRGDAARDEGAGDCGVCDVAVGLKPNDQLRRI